MIKIIILLVFAILLADARRHQLDIRVSCLRLSRKKSRWKKISKIYVLFNIFLHQQNTSRMTSDSTFHSAHSASTSMDGWWLRSRSLHFSMELRIKLWVLPLISRLKIDIIIFLTVSALVVYSVWPVARQDCFGCNEAEHRFASRQMLSRGEKYAHQWASFILHYGF